MGPAGWFMNAWNLDPAAEAMFAMNRSIYAYDPEKKPLVRNVREGDDRERHEGGQEAQVKGEGEAMVGMLAKRQR